MGTLNTVFSTTISLSGSGVSIEAVDEENFTSSTLASCLTGTASSIGSEQTPIKIQIVEDSMAYVESMSMEELENFDKQLEAKGIQLDLGNNEKNEVEKVYTKVRQQL